MSGSDALGWRLDTTCQAVLSDDTGIIINPFPSYIKSVWGLQYFKNLTLFYCNNDSLESLPAGLYCVQVRGRDGAVVKKNREGVTPGT